MTKNSTLNSALRALAYIAFAAILAALAAYAVIGQSTHVTEGYYLSDKSAQDFNSGWEWDQDPATARIETILPFRNEAVSAGEEFSISKALPDIEDSTWSLMLWNKGQKLDAYVGDELRYSFSADTSDALSAQTPWTYLFIPLGPSDSGKKITLVMSATNAEDVGQVGEAVIGSEIANISSLVNEYGLEIVFGIFLLIMGACSIAISIAISRKAGRIHPLWLLGIAVILAAVWLICNCRLRQFLFPDAGTVRDIAFLVAAILPIPFITYLDRLQHERYHIPVIILDVVCGANFAIQFVLNALRLCTTGSMFYASLALIAITIVMAIATMLADSKKNKLIEYRAVCFGLLAFAVCTVAQILSYVTSDTTVTSGVIFMIGMAILVGCCMYDALSSLVRTRAERQEAVDRAQKLTIQALESLAMTVDANDHYTSGHCVRVARYSREIGKRLGHSEKEQGSLYYKGLLHDVGKIGIPDSIVNKQGELTAEERETIRRHTIIGDEILSRFTEIPNICVGARWHHERWDGSGYPDGLTGESIPLDARIIAVADAYDAMSSRRSYRDVLPQEVARAEMKKGAGTQFDPAIVAVMLEMIDEDVDYQMREHHE